MKQKIVGTMLVVMVAVCCNVDLSGSLLIAGPNTSAPMGFPAGPANLAYVGNSAKPAIGAYSNNAAGLNDGKYGDSNGWCAIVPESVFQIELAKTAKIGSFRFGRDRTGNAADRAMGYLKIDVSLDGQRWQTVFEKKDVSSLPDYGYAETLQIRISSVEARFIRVMVCARPNEQSPGIDEFEVYAAVEAAPNAALPDIAVMLRPPLPRPQPPIDRHGLVTTEQYESLESQVRTVLAMARMQLSEGTTIYAPCGMFYRGLWPRDYEYVVEGAGDIINPADLHAVCKLMMRLQRPDGWVPIYIGGNLSPCYVNVGPKPETDSAPFFVKLVYQDFLRRRDVAFTASALAPMKRAMDSTPRDMHGLVWIDPAQRHSGYGFTDAEGKTGQELFSSLLYWEACGYIETMARAAGKEDFTKDFAARAKQIEQHIDDLKDERIGLYFAASRDCRQLDVWGNAYLVYIGFPDSARRLRISRYLAEHYGEYVASGQVRQLFGKEHWQSSPIPPETYQNGGYWGTASGWVAYAIAQVDPPLASKMLGDMIDYFQRHGACESINDAIGHRKHRNYSATVTLPMAAIRRLREEGQVKAK